MDHAVYIVFSATPTGMGSLIRKATRNRYNHVSLSLSRDIHKMYTFARLHRTIPLYGGFVVESILRYQSFAGSARVKICRVAVPEPQLTYLHNLLERLWNDREEYIYNTPAALASLVHLRPAISKAYTCVTFVQGILARYHLAGVSEADCPTVRSLERRLAPYVIYEGPAPASAGDWGEDIYPMETTTRYAVYTTARHFGRLAKRVLLGGGLMAGAKKRAALTLLLVTAGIGVMALVEGVLRPTYPVKSALKLAVFLGFAGLYLLLTRDGSPFRAFQRPRRFRPAALLALGVLVFLLGGYLLLSPWLDLSAIPENLAAKEGITAQTFPLAALYITFCNSLLEEFFFRGFAFLTLHRAGYPRLAYGFSALAFAVYHVSITDGWGAPILVALMVAGLTAAGLLFNWLDRDGSLLPSWLVHMGANLATNTVGLMLFGIL